MSRILSFAAMAVAAGLCIAAVPSSEEAVTASHAEQGVCADNLFIGVHGVSEVATPDNMWMGGTVFRFYNNYVRPAADASRTSILGTGVGSPYLGVAITELIGQAGIGADVPEDVANGVSGLKDQIDTALSAGCGDQDIILSGYSEGAWVINEFLSQHQDLAKNLEAIVLFGDPQFDGCNPNKSESCNRYVQRSTNGDGVVRALAPKLAVSPYVPAPLITPDPGDDDANTELQENTVSYCSSEYRTVRRKKVEYHDPVCNWKVYARPGNSEAADVRACLLGNKVCEHSRYDVLFGRATNFLKTNLIP